MILKGANMMNKLISYFGTFTPGADGAVGAFQFEYLTSLGFAALVIFAGRAIVRRSHVLRKFAIPAPVISGLLFSVLIAIFKGTGILAISFDTNVSQRSATIASCMRKKGSYRKNKLFCLLAAATLRFVQSYLNDIASMRDSEIKHCQSWREHYYATEAEIKRRGKSESH